MHLKREEDEMENLLALMMDELLISHTNRQPVQAGSFHPVNVSLWKFAR